ncbi:PDZ domain-containing protein [Chitinophaga oryziterrae]|uniref:PDZ domain-containing protein n=1 Tax=Chitinophaga oryziterrae TaxID=1031224 RepID=A0A6N8JKC3_9BACT|nr:site-2 protease family protein [Chitinophaga oryziterrae]MVT44829.1 PDZ domain-containing protein [Chitinophaga oryziterrae]
MTTEVLLRTLQLLFSLSIVALLHGLGHFIPAKLFKTRVEIFYLFLDPLFSFFKKKKGDTASQRWEFRSKPAWQRLIIMIGGVTVNLILAFFIYVMVCWNAKESYLPTKNLTYGIVVDSLAESIGLRDGDMVLSVNSAPVENFRAIPAEILLREATSIQVERDGKPLNIAIPVGFFREMIRSKTTLMNVRIPFNVDSIVPNSAAQKAGLQKGDQLLTINGAPAHYIHEFKKTIQLYKDQTVLVQVLRNGDTLQLTTQIPETGILGIGGGDPMMEFKFASSGYTFSEAIPAGFKKFKTTFSNYFQQLWLIIIPKEVDATESLGGFVSIASLFPAHWDWMAFWEMTALLSIILAFLNMLPIPPMDGWYVLFLLYEIVTSRKPGEKFLKYSQVVGIVVLCSFLLYVNGRGIWNSIFN